MKNERSKKISDLVLGLEIIDRTLDSVRSEFTDDALTPKQIDLVGILIRNPQGLPIKEIAKRLNVSSSAVVQIIDSFCDKKFIGRKSASNDKRKSVAHLSKSAQKYIQDNVILFTTKYDEKIFSVLSDKELIEYVTMTNKIANYIEPIVTNDK